jgi:hypothetical protein
MKPIAQKIQAMVAESIVAEPNKSYFEIGGDFGISAWMVAKIAVQFGIRRRHGAGSPAYRREKRK